MKTEKLQWIFARSSYCSQSVLNFERDCVEIGAFVSEIIFVLSATGLRVRNWRPFQKFYLLWTKNFTTSSDKREENKQAEMKNALKAYYCTIGVAKKILQIQVLDKKVFGKKKRKGIWARTDLNLNSKVIVLHSIELFPAFQTNSLSSLYWKIGKLTQLTTLRLQETNNPMEKRNYSSINICKSTNKSAKRILQDYH